MSATEGMISNIQRCSVHDGPGIRTTVFLKGCNMACAWCHNPETISFAPETLFHPDRCIHCGMCAEGCFSGARVICGEKMTVDEVFRQIELDLPYYGEDGGVTISGGEPLCQPEFTASLLAICKAHHIRTAIETNMSIPFETAQKVLKECDLIMTDLKIFDEALHIEHTGVSNKIVMENQTKAAKLGIPMILRTPVIPGINNTPEEIGAIAKFASTLPSLLYYELLPYHPLGMSKGVVENQRKRFAVPDKENMNQLAKEASRFCDHVWVAGKAYQK